MANSVILRYQNCWLKRKFFARSAQGLSYSWHFVNSQAMKRFIIFAAVTMVLSSFVRMAPQPVG